MKKIAIFCALLLVAVIAFAGGSAEADEKTITVGATPEPHAEMLNLVKDDLAKAGYILNIIEFTDYVTPNAAVESGEIDANFFQHLPYMDSFNNEKGYHLVSAGGIHVEPIALYSKRITAIADIKDGAIIAIPNDPTNGGRALLLLQASGLITLSQSAGITATPLDITANPKNFKFTEIEAASLPRVLDDVDAAIINGNYALPAGLNAKKDGLIIEGADSPYVNIISVKSGNETKPAVQALVKALQSTKIKEWINTRYPNGDVVATF